MTVGATVDVDGITESINPVTFALSTGVATIAGTYYGIASASVTPQTLTMIAHMTNQAADTSIDLTY